MFIIATKGDFDLTYANKEVKSKFKGLLSKMHDQKANFIILQRLVALDLTSDGPLIWGFTTHWGEIPNNWGKKLHPKKDSKKERR